MLKLNYNYNGKGGVVAKGKNDYFYKGGGLNPLSLTCLQLKLLGLESYNFEPSTLQFCRFSQNIKFLKSSLVLRMTSRGIF